MAPVAAERMSLCAVVVVERNALIRQLLMKQIADFSRGPVTECRSLSELAAADFLGGPAVLLPSHIFMTIEEKKSELALLKHFDRSLRAIVLAKTDYREDTRAALICGANGYL